MDNLVASILGSQAVQGALAIVAVSIVGWLIRRFAHARHVANLAILAYKYAEKEGLMQGIDGHGKLALFMGNFIERYKEQNLGQAPSAQDKGDAVKTAEREVEREDHLGK